MNQDTEKIIKAAKLGGEVLRKYFGQSLETTEKSRACDFQTIADVEADKKILESLSLDFPTYNIHTEESGKIDKGSEYTFSIDPLDGTNNFVLGIPNFSVSIALLKNDEIMIGVIYVPMLEQIYYAEKGKGSFVDGKRLEVNKEAKYEKATVAFNCGYSTKKENYLKILNNLEEMHPKRVITNWSCAYDFCLLASGRVESILSVGSELYDFAAGKLIASEAGAFITDLDGNPEKSDRNNFFLTSSTNEVHTKMITFLKGAL